MKYLAVVLTAACTIAACSSSDSNSTNPPDTSSGDTTNLSQINDTISLDIRKLNSSLPRTFTVYDFRPSPTLHDIAMSSATGIKAGTITVAVMKNEETLWQHTFTKDSTTWNVTGQAQGAISTIKVLSSSATGNITGRIVGR